MSKSVKNLLTAVIVLAMIVTTLVIPVSAESDVVKLNDTGYTSLKDALANAQDNDVITLLSNITLDETLTVGKKVTIDGQSQYSVTGNAKKTFEVKASATFKNITINNTASYGRCIDTRVGGITLTLNNVNLKTTGNGNTQPLTIGGDATGTGALTVNITESDINAGNSGYGIITYNPVNMTIDNSTVYGYAALYMKGKSSSAGSAGSVVTITNNSKLTGYNEHSGESNSFGTIVFEDNNITIKVENSKLEATKSEGNADQGQTIFGLKNATSITIDASKSNTLTGDILAGLSDNDRESTITVPANYIKKLQEEGHSVKLVNGKVTATNKVIQTTTPDNDDDDATTPPTTTNPSTGDNVYCIMFSVILALAGIAILAASKRKFDN